jgi:GNAT superfamily N-acetyltransferase
MERWLLGLALMPTVSGSFRKNADDTTRVQITHYALLLQGCIAALHVRPEWRRLGLAQVVVNTLCQKQARTFKTFDADYQLYNQAVIENFNGASESMFKKLGWTKTDVGVTWIRCVPEKS